MALVITYLIIMVFPGVVLTFLLPKNRYSVPEKIMLLPLLGTAVSIVIPSILSMCGIRLTRDVILAIYLLILSATLIVIAMRLKSASPVKLSKFWQFDNQSVVRFLKSYWPLMVLVFLEMCGLGAKLLPGLQIYAPPLHDPATHAILAKRIVDTGYIRYFYSPGLHILTAFSTILSGSSIPKNIIYITNFFNAYVGVGIYFLIIKIFRRPWWAISAAAMVIFGFYPTLFYVTAGKNALIIALCLLPLGMLLSWDAFFGFLECKLAKVILPSLLFAAVVLAHYPSVYMFLTFILAALVRKYILLSGRPLKRLTVVIRSLAVACGAGFLVSIAWLASHYSYFLEDARNTVSQSAASTAHLSWHSIATDLYGTAAGILSFDKSPLFIFTAIGLLGWAYIVYVKEWRWFALWPLSFCLGLAAMPVFHSSSLMPIWETATISFFLLTTIGASLVASAIFDFVHGRNRVVLATLFLIGVVCLSIIQSVVIYRKFSADGRALSVVSKDDLKAMRWIDVNIPENAVILNNTTKVGMYIFGTDAGHWIPVYTKNRVAMPFSSQGSRYVLDCYNLLRSLEKNPSDQKARLRMNELGIKYIYIGAKNAYPHRKSLKASQLKRVGYERVYTGGGASIFAVTK